MLVIARIHNDFPTKFGLPRQSGLAPSLRSKIVFEPDYRTAEAVRGLDGFSHIWLLWGFSGNARPLPSGPAEPGKDWSPTVRPPRLGGNVRMGVFATRSPFRPNPIGLSCVRLAAVEAGGAEGPVLVVSGADLMDGTPIYDIKPYLPGVDAHPDARDGFVGSHPQELLAVEIDPALSACLSDTQRATLREILAQDPRPAYHACRSVSGRIYGFAYAGRDIHFTVENNLLKAY